MLQPEKLITVKEISEQYNILPVTIRQTLNRKKIKPISVKGKTNYYAKAEVLNLFKPKPSPPPEPVNNTHELVVLKNENDYLRKRIAELEAEKKELYRIISFVATVKTTYPER